MTPPFPTVFWGQTRATFVPIEQALPIDAPARAVLVFAFQAAHLVVADIVGRGWCIPGGHLEPGETPEQAARRETWEEIGATLQSLRPIGNYLLTDTATGATTRAPCFVAEVTLDALPAGTESRGVERMTLEELPDRYYTWDPLMEAVFRYAALHTP